MKPLDIINPLRNSEPYIQNIFSMGGCYKFHVFLKSIFPSAEPYLNFRKNHVVSKINGRYYDIDGEIPKFSNDWYSPFTADDYDMVSDWSFSRNHLLSAGECKFCGEPFTLDVFEEQESVI